MKSDMWENGPISLLRNPLVSCILTHTLTLSFSPNTVCKPPLLQASSGSLLNEAGESLLTGPLVAPEQPLGANEGRELFA